MESCLLWRNGGRSGGGTTSEARSEQRHVSSSSTNTNMTPLLMLLLAEVKCIVGDLVVPSRAPTQPEGLDLDTPTQTFHLSALNDKS